MHVLTTRDQLAEWVSSQRKEHKTIGFVPTMGALHQGHLALVMRAKSENDLAVSSIFVNPIQFNNKEDLEKYPRNKEADSALLKQAGCDAVFMPSVEEMYPEGEVTETHNFGTLEQVMEGTFRPGHFNGVAVVVKRLLQLSNPHRAYFGEKDYQQLQIIKALVKKEKMEVEIIPCPIVREADGLAMSSRNMRLTAENRALAPFIHRVMQQAADFQRSKSVSELKSWVADQFKPQSVFQLEYFEISDAETLEVVQNWNSGQQTIACIAIWLGGIRLIDNIKL